MAQVKKNVLTSLDKKDFMKLKAIAENESRSLSSKLRIIVKAYLNTVYMPRTKKKRIKK